MGGEKKIGCLSIFLIILVIGFLINLIKRENDKKPTSSLVAQSFKEDPPIQKPIEPPAPQYTPMERLKEAKKALNDKSKSMPYGRLGDAEEHLKNIRPEENEHEEAKKLLAEIEKRRAILKKQADKEIGKFLANARKLYAIELEKQYLSKGMDIEVLVSGEDNTAIKLKYVLMTRPLVYKLTAESDFLQVLKKQGFKKVILSDGFNYTWTFDLTK